MAFQGIDVRQTGDRLVFRASLKDSSGAVVSTGTTNLRLYELQNDGTLKSYDWNDNTFKTTALTTENQTMTHRTGNNATTNTGLWTYALTTLTGFTAGNIYFAQVSNSGASPTEQEREFQFGVSSAFNPYDAVRGGLTALPNANADAAGGLPISDAGGLDMDAILVDTAAMQPIIANLPDSGALSSLATASALTTVDTVVDSILAGVNQEPKHWYLDSNAVGANDGTSPTDAWQTFGDMGNSASAGGLKPGDVLHIRGTFTGEPLSINVNRITVYAYGAIIDGTGNATVYNVYVNGAHGTKWFGGEIRDATGGGTNAFGMLIQNANGVLVRDVWTHDNSYAGISMQGCRNSIIEYCHAHDENHIGIAITNATGVDPDENNANNKMRYCKAWNCSFLGLFIGGANGQENLKGLEAYGNEAWLNGIGMRLESGYYVKLFNNSFWENDNPKANGSATKTDLEIEDGDSCEIFDNWFLEKQATGYNINFIENVNKPNRHKIYRNRIHNNFSGNVAIRLAVNGTTGIEITDNVIVTDGTGTTSRCITLCQATSGVIAGNIIKGGGYGIYLNPVSTVAITAADWTVTDNTFDGQASRAINTATTANTDVTLLRNRFVNQALAGWVAVRLAGTVTYYGVAGGTVNPITDKDADARTDEPNYRGPISGTFKGRDYTLRNVSLEQVTQQATVAALNDLSLADIATALETYDGPTKDELDTAQGVITAAIAALNDLAPGDLDAALTALRLDELFVNVLSAQPTAGSLLGDLTEDDAGTQRFTANALELAPSSGGGGTGTGPSLVTVTVVDTLVNPKQNVWVTLWDGTSLLARGQTDPDGLVELSVPDGTGYTLTAYLGGYTHTPQSVDVSGVTDVDVTITQIASTPSDPGFVTGQLTVFNKLGAYGTGIIVYLKAVGDGPAGFGLSDDVRTATVDVNGIAEFTNLIPGFTYRYWIDEKYHTVDYTIDIDAVSPVLLPAIVG